MRHLRRIGRIGLSAARLPGLALLVLLFPVDLGAVTKERFEIREEARHIGNAYVFAEETEILGTLEGDFLGFTRTFHMEGAITDDLQVGAQWVRVGGEVGDSLRAFAQEIKVTGEVGGDLVAFAQTVHIAAGARVGGNVIVLAGRVEIDGTVGGELKTWGGTTNLRGTVEKDAQLRSEVIEIAPEARIGGDLTYTGGEPLELEGTGIVQGDIEFIPQVDEVSEPEPVFAYLPWLFWIWSMAGAIIVGMIALAVFRGTAGPIVDAASTATLQSLGAGFIVAIVTPIAVGVASLPIITIPLTSILFVLFLVGLYLAKLPTAAWIGRGILRAAGSRNPSLPVGLILGIAVLYLLFLIPYLGLLLWLAATFLGFGAIILGTYARCKSPSAPPPVSGGPQPDGV